MYGKLKKIATYTFLLILIIFSFFYTEKTMTIVKNTDPIMIDLLENKDKYLKLNIEGEIVDNTIIPGKNGCEVDIDKSYIKLKKLGTFNSNLLVYKNIINNNLISNNYDKYIISGNKKDSYVSVIFKVKSNDKIEGLLEYINNKNINATFFIDGKFIEDNIELIASIVNKYEIYAYGYNNSFLDKDNLYAQSLLFKIKYDIKKLCLNETMNNDYLNYCSNNKISSIKPSISTNINLFKEVKNNVENGSIISIEINENSMNELNTTINYLYQKGFNIKTISELISENIKCTK